VLEEARKGNLEALKAVGHTQEADKHPVCQKLLAFIGPGKKGSEIRENFEAPPYGWPRDAIDGALYALLASGHVKATDAAVQACRRQKPGPCQAHADQLPARERQHHADSAHQDSHRCSSAVGVPCQPKEELNQGCRCPAGQAARSRPPKRAARHPRQRAPPKLIVIEAIEAQSGNAQLLELFTRHDEIVWPSRKAWSKTADEIAKRIARLAQAGDLLRHAKALGPYAKLKAEANAIEGQRSLLADPDPVRPLLDETVDLLRQALNAKLDAFNKAHEQQQALLQQDADWRKLSDAQRDDLTAQHHLTPPAAALATGHARAATGRAGRL
jgi:hypothetical protein